MMASSLIFCRRQVLLSSRRIAIPSFRFLSKSCTLSNGNLLLSSISSSSFAPTIHTSSSSAITTFPRTCRPFSKKVTVERTTANSNSNKRKKTKTKRGQKKKLHNNIEKERRQQQQQQQQQRHVVSPDQEKERRIVNLQQEVRFYHERGAYDKALDVSYELLRCTEDHFGTDHPATASSHNNVGLMYKLLGNFSEAKRHYHRALRSYQFVLGEDHESYAAALHNLGMLYRSQIALDDEVTITAMDRLALMEEAVEFFQRAYDIRTVELGPEHPHTIASQSALGSTLALRVLQLAAAAQRRQQQQQSQQQSQSQNVTSVDRTEWRPSKITTEQWNVAIGHLRSALTTSVVNPRGTQLDGEQTLQEKDGASPTNPYRNIVTLSSASVAQNLAVIIKTQATTLSSSSSSSSLSLLSNNDRNDLLGEAKQLYERVLYVRTALLQNDSHPDVITTKHSLAELLDVMDDVHGANALRHEIMNAYDITEV